MATIVEQKYRCKNCGAEDTLKLFPQEPAPPVVNCWRCHAGYGLPVHKMLNEQLGMFPTGAFPTPQHAG